MPGPSLPAPRASILTGADGGADNARIEQFARGLTAAGLPTSVVNGWAVMPGGVIILGESDLYRLSSEPEGLAGRAGDVILLAADPNDVLDLVERLLLAGAVDLGRWVDWLAEPNDDRHAGIVGLRRVGERLGWPMSEGPVFSRPDYAYLYGPGRSGLPEELAAYLQAYADERGLTPEQGDVRIEEEVSDAQL